MASLNLGNCGSQAEFDSEVIARTSRLAGHSGGRLWERTKPRQWRFRQDCDEYKCRTRRLVTRSEARGTAAACACTSRRVAGLTSTRCLTHAVVIILPSLALKKGLAHVPECTGRSSGL
jgi:hypothetical protein